MQPIEFYVLPPVSKHLATGDVLEGTVCAKSGLWVVMHPTCDMVPRIRGKEIEYKAEYVVLAEATPLVDYNEYTDWRGDNTKNKRLENLMNNNRDKQPERYWFMPGVLTIPDSVLDFQRIVVDKIDSVLALKKIASLDSPFAENLLTSYVRYKARIGQPRLDASSVIENQKCLNRAKDTSS